MIFIMMTVGVLLAPGPIRAQSAPPDSVRLEDSGEPGFVVMSWPVVPEADGYRIYAEIAVTVVDSQGNLYIPIPWGYLGQPDDGDVIRVKIATLTPEGEGFFGVATVKDGVESEPVWPISPDFNLDGWVNLDDYFLFADAFGSTQRRFDLDRDGLVTLDDFFLFVAAFGSTSGW